MSVMNAIHRRVQGSRDEGGFALASVLGIIMVLVILSAVVVAAAASSAGFATSRRASVQSRAAADAGVEAVRALLLKGTMVCNLPGSVPGYSSGSVKFTATVRYVDQNGAPITCARNGLASPASTQSVSQATVITAGTASAKGVAGNSSNDTARMGAVIAIQATDNGEYYKSAVFTDAALVFANQDSMLGSTAGAVDADIYSNGSITCPTSGGTIQGSITAQGGLNLMSSNCLAFGDIWVNGSVAIGNAGTSYSPLVEGNIVATGSVSTNNAVVYGNVIANGAITLGQPNANCANGTQANVCGSVYSLGASAAVSGNTNGSKVLGSIYSRGPVTFGTNGSGTPVGQDLVSLANITGKSTVGGNLAAATTIDSQVTQSATNARTGHANTKCAGFTGATKCVKAQLTLPTPANAAPPFAVDSKLFTQSDTSNLGTISSASDLTTLLAGTTGLTDTTGNLTVVNGPTYQPMPQVTDATANNFADWIGSGWTRFTVPSTWCSTSDSALATNVNDVLTNGPLGASRVKYAANTKLVMDFSACTSGVTGSNLKITKLDSNHVTDLAFYLPTGIVLGNDTVIDAVDNNLHSFYVVSPGYARGALDGTGKPTGTNGVAWTAAPTVRPKCYANIDPTSPNTVVSTWAQPNPNLIINKIQTLHSTQFFAYTPCALVITNGSGTSQSNPMVGQLYAGQESFPTSLYVRVPQPGDLAVIPGTVIPGGGSTGSGLPYVATVTNRYNIGG